MSFRKTLALCLSLLLIGGCAVTGTLAFPDFLSELFSNGNTEDQGQRLKIDLEVEEDLSLLMIPGKHYPKKGTITNSGDDNVEAYVWYTYAVPEALFLPDNLNEHPLTVSFAAGDEWINNAPVYADGMNYRIDSKSGTVEFTCLYKEVLGPNEEVPISMQFITLNKHIDRTKDGQYIWVEDDQKIPLGYNKDTIEILFSAQAVIADNVFTDVESAYKALKNNPDLLTAEKTAG